MKVTWGPEFGALKPIVPMVDKVSALGEEILKMPQYEPPTKEYLHAGMYCREVFRKAGVCIVGKVHKKEHFYMVMSGTVAITTDAGVQEVTGPHIFCSFPGTKRAIFALTDATCVTVHRTDKESFEGIEEELVIDDPRSAFTLGNKLKQEYLS